MASERVSLLTIISIQSFLPNLSQLSRTKHTTTYNMPSIEEKPEDDGNDRKRSPERVESDRRSSNGESRTEPQQRSDKRQRVASNSSKSRPKSGRKFLTAYNIYFRDERRRILDSGVSTDDLYESEGKQILTAWVHEMKESLGTCPLTNDFILLQKWSLHYGQRKGKRAFKH